MVMSNHQPKRYKQLNGVLTQFGLKEFSEIIYAECLDRLIIFKFVLI